MRLTDTAVYAFALIGGGVCAVLVLAFIAAAVLPLFDKPFQPPGD